MLSLSVEMARELAKLNADLIWCEVNAYQITSDQGVECGPYEAASPLGALDAMARDAGCADHNAACVIAGASFDDWTTDRRAFKRGDIGLLVVEVES